jgi:hypothetical protein
MMVSVGKRTRLFAAALLAAGSGVALALLLLDTGEARCRGCKSPPFEATWSYQLDGKPRTGGALVHDIDGFDTSAGHVRRLHDRKRYAICYIDAGTWENWRPDRRRFPRALLGRSNGWPGERWLDIRRLDVLLPIMRDRFAMCARKGFDAVEPDNVDGYANETGFPLTARDQLRFNRALARLAHRAGLAVGLKNDLDQAAALRRDFDFAVVEQCFQYDECERTRAFTRMRKPVFAVEYELPRAQFCARARALRINALRAPLDLDRPGVSC